MMQARHLWRAALAAMLMGLAATAHADIAGQTNQDIDLFLTNPAIAADRPNVLIIWDNTANWGQQVSGNTAYSFELQAIKTVISNLSDQFNVGLMLFSESGGGANVKGAYVRYAVRQTTSANRTALVNLVNSLNKNGDAGSSAFYATAMYEAYLYFGGKSAYAGALQAKRDYPNNPANTYAGPLSGNAFSSSGSTTYVSPAASGCQKNYIIFLSNGPVDSGENNASQSTLSSLHGLLGSDPIHISPNQEQASWADEFSRFLNLTNVGPAGMSGTANFVTYTINVFDPTKAGLNSIASHIALMKSMAAQGQGKYFAASDSNSVTAAMNQIFTEVQAVNSVFASTTLPVSVNVRGTNLNQVYIGVFRPDANLSPRWYGNFKEYQFALDSNTNQLYLADANNNAAYNASTGFIASTATSFWTVPSNFWGFRPSSENGVGGASDLPDGDLVEKGATAEGLRNALAASPATRTLLTCIAPCASGPLASPFNTVTIPTSSSSWQAAFGVTNASYVSPLDGAGGKAAELRDILNWVSGQDNAIDENANGSFADVRASIHGDVLHSKPAIINYNRNGDSNDVYAFYGSNDGVVHAVRGGNAANAGAEIWGFVPHQFFGQLKRLRDNSPGISSSATKPYFVDGSIGVYQYDANHDGKLVATDGDKVYLYLSMRRGGPYIIALDVSDPAHPGFMWERDATSSGYGELGQTWSTPQVRRIRGSANPVLIIGAGYDANAEDALPATADSKGRGILIVDAMNGNVIWQAGPAPSGGTYTLAVAQMTNSINADAAIIDRDSDGYADRAYFGDTGGKIWRVDLGNANPANWTVSLLASIAGAGPSGSRKFLYAADVVYGSDANGAYDAVLIGSGDREHPFDTTVVNRYYMFKDRKTGSSGVGQPTITEADLYDATSDALQTATGAALVSARAALLAAKGWMVTLAAGEKVIGGSTTIAGTTYFNTNQPATSAPANSCANNLGVARAYAVSYTDAQATAPLAGTPVLDASSRYAVVAGGGYLPSPIPVVVQLNGKIIQGVISGTYVQTAGAAQLNWRYRTFWELLHD